MDLNIAHPIMVTPIYPQTPESIALARADCERERDRLQALGLIFDPVSGTTKLLPQGAPRLVKIEPIQAVEPLDDRLACAEAIDQVVETHGLPAVIRAVRLIAAVNGRTL